MSYHVKMLPIYNSISILLMEPDSPRLTLEAVLTNLSEGRSIEALELLCQKKRESIFSFEKSSLAEVEKELALAIISHAQTIFELQRVYKATDLSVENKMVLWARAAGLKYRAPIPARED